MNNQHIHIDQPHEISVVFTACMISLLRTLKRCDSTDIEDMAFLFAEDIISRILVRLDGPAIDYWRLGVVKAISEITTEGVPSGGDRPSNTSDTGGNV